MAGSPPAVSPRRALRIPRRAGVLLADGAAERFLGYVADISETGAFIQSSNPRPIGTKLDVAMHLFGRFAPPFRCPAEVVWVRGYGGRQGPCPGMGVRFGSLEGEAVVALREFCAERDVLPGPTPTARAGPSRH